MSVANHSLLYDNALLPFFKKVQAYIPKGITPNMITILNLLIVLGVFISKQFYNPLVLMITIFIYYFLDNLDGIYARESKQTSNLGEILDHGNDIFIGILIFYMLFMLLNGELDTYTKIILILIFFNTILFLLKDIYFHKIDYGFKYFSLDEALILLIFVPLLKYFNTSKQKNKLFTNGLCIILILFSIYNSIDFIPQINTLADESKPIIITNLITTIVIMLVSYYLLAKNYSVIWPAFIYYLFVVYLIINKQNNKNKNKLLIN